VRERETRIGKPATNLLHRYVAGKNWLNHLEKKDLVEKFFSQSFVLLLKLYHLRILFDICCNWYNFPTD
jgi:hypothetical protein